MCANNKATRIQISKRGYEALIDPTSLNDMWSWSINLENRGSIENNIFSLSSTYVKGPNLGQFKEKRETRPQ